MAYVALDHARHSLEVCRPGLGHRIGHHNTALLNRNKIVHEIA
ncbi:hypothetical protein SALB1_0749 [Salinisphaera sp. LB1]|nr:hypothetical protein SALB1_0749 [Salinisphaera sp. LB1]